MPDLDLLGSAIDGLEDDLTDLVDRVVKLEQEIREIHTQIGQIAYKLQMWTTTRAIETQDRKMGRCDDRKHRRSGDRSK